VPRTELRQDPTTRDWVIIAPDRSRRPHLTQTRPPELVVDEMCPFCRGHEATTPSRQPDELRTGMAVNLSLPEETAATLRAALHSVG
jgi:galactose-1-phosphate uridylyltransferase